MTAPSRSELPQDFVAILEQQDRSMAKTYGKKPILPAPSTPTELAEAAEELDAMISKYRRDGSEAAGILESDLREHIENVRRGAVSKPLPDLPTHRQLEESDLRAKPDLESAFVWFKSLITGRDFSSPGYMKFVREGNISIRKRIAAEHNLGLELTDDEWFAL